MAQQPNLQQLFDEHLDLLDAPRMEPPRYELMLDCLLLIAKEAERFNRDEKNGLVSAIAYTLFEGADLRVERNRCPLCKE